MCACITVKASVDECLPNILFISFIHSRFFRFLHHRRLRTRAAPNKSSATGWYLGSLRGSACWSGYRERTREDGVSAWPSGRCDWSPTVGWCGMSYMRIWRRQTWQALWDFEHLVVESVGLTDCFPAAAFFLSCDVCMTPFPIDSSLPLGCFAAGIIVTYYTPASSSLPPCY